MCRSGKVNSSAVILDQYQLICPKILDSDSFLIPVPSFWSVSDSCSSLTSLPLVLNEPLPRHITFLTDKSICNASCQPPVSVCSDDISEQSNLEETTSLVSNDRTVDCPECKTSLILKTPEDIVRFAAHYYQHHSLEHTLIAVFVETIKNLKKFHQLTMTLCPLEFCAEQFSGGQTFEKHVRRKHQFEVLLLHMLMKDNAFLSSKLYETIIQLCPNSKVQKFIQSLFHSQNGNQSNIVKKEKGASNYNQLQSINLSDQDKGDRKDGDNKKTKPDLDKARATSLMKQFFRQHYEDRECQSFLTSRGEVLTVKVYEKLVCFIYLVASDDEEAGQLVQFALKNLKTVMQEGKEIAKESLSHFQNDLNSIYYLIYGFKQRCATLKLPPTQCDKHVVLAFLQSLVSGCETETRATFLSWLSSVHQRVDGKPLETHQEFTNLGSGECFGMQSSN